MLCVWFYLSESAKSFFFFFCCCFVLYFASSLLCVIWVSVEWVVWFVMWVCSLYLLLVVTESGDKIHSFWIMVYMYPYSPYIYMYTERTVTISSRCISIPLCVSLNYLLLLLNSVWFSSRLYIYMSFCSRSFSHLLLILLLCIASVYIFCLCNLRKNKQIV